MRILLALPVLVILAGCMGEPAETRFTVAEDAGSFQDTHTGDGYDLRVRVTDANGTPLPKAAVVWFTGGDDLVAFTADGGVGPDGPRGEASMAVSISNSRAEMIAGARTADDGIATADLKPGRSVHVAAGDASGLTTEVRFNVAVGGGGTSGTVTIILYPERVPIEQTVTMGNHLGIGGHVGQPAKESWPLALAGDAALDAQLRSRLHVMDLHATWENKLGEGADLYVGLGTDPAVATWIGDDQQQYVMDGRHTESLFVERFHEAGGQLGQRGLHAFLFTDWVSGGMDGVPVQLHGEALLKGSNVVIE